MFQRGDSLFTLKDNEHVSSLMFNLPFHALRGQKAIGNFHNVLWTEALNCKIGCDIPTLCHWIGSLTVVLISHSSIQIIPLPSQFWVRIFSAREAVRAPTNDFSLEDINKHPWVLSFTLLPVYPVRSLVGNPYFSKRQIYETSHINLSLITRCIKHLNIQRK